MTEAQLGLLMGDMVEQLETVFTSFDSLSQCSVEMRGIIASFVGQGIDLRQIDLETNKTQFNSAKGRLLMTRSHNGHFRKYHGNT
jgi:hypothetical protein